MIMQKYNTEGGKGSKAAPPPPAPSSGYVITDPEEFGRNMLQLIEEGSRAFSDLLARGDGAKGPYSGASEMAESLSTLGALSQRWLADPLKLAEAQGALARDYFDLWNISLRRMLGEPVEPVA